MSPGGDGIYCCMFIVRERWEVLSSHSPWPGREPGTCLLFPRAEEGVGWQGPDTYSHGPKWCMGHPPRSSRGWPLTVCHLTLSKSGSLNCTSRTFQGTLKIQIPHTILSPPSYTKDSVLRSFRWGSKIVFTLSSINPHIPSQYRAYIISIMKVLA